NSLIHEYTMLNLWGLRVHAMDLANEDIERLASPHLLVIDDLGTEAPGQKRDEALFKLFDQRHQPTVVTTNMDMDVFTESVGARVADRIADFPWLQLGGPSRRRQPLTWDTDDEIDEHVNAVIDDANNMIDDDHERGLRWVQGLIEIGA